MVQGFGSGIGPKGNEWRCPAVNVLLGISVVPFPFFSLGPPFLKLNNRKIGTLVMKGLVLGESTLLSACAKGQHPKVSMIKRKKIGHRLTGCVLAKVNRTDHLLFQVLRSSS